MNIAIIYSLPTRRALATPYKATDEDTKDSAEEVATALTTKGAHVSFMPLTEDAIEQVRDIKTDCIFNLVEWDGLDLPLSLRVLELLEETSIPYTCARKEAIHTTNDKALLKLAFDRYELPTARWQIFTSGNEQIRDDFVYPVIVKLTLDHCSVGLSPRSVVSKQEDLRTCVQERLYDHTQPVLVEEFIDGRELQVTLLEREKGLSILPPAEILFTTKGTEAFLSFESRWDETHPDYDTSTVDIAKLSPSLMQKLSRICHRTFRVLNLRDYARFDIRVRDDEIFFLEANANPGLGDDEDYGMTVSYKAAGMSFTDFCWEIVESCLRRWKRYHS